MLDWLVIGGGIHGTYMSSLLVHEAGIPADTVRVLDPHPEPLALWNRHTLACGMKHLRSPSTHNIDIPVMSLYRFAKRTSAGGASDFIPLYNRPSLDLFRRHCRATIRDRGLDRLRTTGRAKLLRREGGNLVVETAAERIRTRRVLIAVGLTEQPRWPRWASLLRRQGAKVAHVFGPDFRREAVAPDEKTVVVGGGLSAVQTALALAKGGSGPVCVLSRHRLREVPFDFDPCWIGPKCMRAFVRLPMEKRRPAVDAARRPGTVPAEVTAEWNGAIRENRRLSFEIGRVRSASISGGRIRLHTGSGRRLPADRVVLATGFDARRPGGRFIDRAVEDLDLPVSSCGYPRLGDDLQWGRGIFVTGPLAELRVGPCARNIVGARNAGRLLLACLKCARQPGRGWKG